MAKKADKNLVIVTDSLGIPREEPVRLGPSIVWPFRINGASYIHTRPGYTIVDVLRDADLHLKACDPDLIVLQIGIVDCAPRVLSKNEAKLVRLLPGIRTLLGWLISNYRSSIIKLRDIQYVPIAEFRKGLRQFKEKFQDKTIIAISILPACDAYERLLPGISGKIGEYNTALAEHFDYVDPYAGHAPETLCIDDYHHLNEKGHDLVAKAVNEVIAKKSL